MVYIFMFVVFLWSPGPEIAAARVSVVLVTVAIKTELTVHQSINLYAWTQNRLWLSQNVFIIPKLGTYIECLRDSLTFSSRSLFIWFTMLLSKSKHNFMSFAFWIFDLKFYVIIWIIKSSKYNMPILIFNSIKENIWPTQASFS